MKKIVLTGGGTAGHVTPNLALLPSLEKAGFSVSYIGSYNGIEKTLAESKGLPYYGISSGKFRRYASAKNFTDIFRVLHGISQARGLMKKIKPDIVFSKGGFVSVPVVLAAASRGIPVVIHESDMTPGLANRIAMKKASKICCTFPETLGYLPADKAVLTGAPIREELLHGDKAAGLKFAGFTDDKPMLLVVGGSTGAAKVNEAVWEILPELTQDFNVCHLTGKGKADKNLTGTPGYAQFEYVSDEMKDLLAACSLVVSRAGSNAICEFLATRTPSVLIPLSAQASRGDQILNAKSFQKQGFCEVLDEDTMKPQDVLDAVSKVYNNRETYIQAMEKSPATDAVGKITEILTGLANS
ncbi:MAG: undecaprenyldiphospho-muramoylpentapeptide beta-N-acetylglucosaminyltransferase [Lachnospiraceae bacterium]|jgi:UDP-N-acetylglucosamine--N-acetylmuramyl-(pentapeptide) pyrophosphoryl-undecaprenol N-acetylglucosamine transferase